MKNTEEKTTLTVLAIIEWHMEHHPINDYTDNLSPSPAEHFENNLFEAIEWVKYDSEYLRPDHRYAEFYIQQLLNYWNVQGHIPRLALCYQQEIEAPLFQLAEEKSGYVEALTIHDSE